MKTLNINELREQIADAHRKLQKKVELEEYDEFKKGTEDQLQVINDLLKQLQDKFKILEKELMENKENTTKNSYRVTTLINNTLIDRENRSNAPQFKDGAK